MALSISLAGWAWAVFLLWRRRRESLELRKLVHELRAPLTALRLGLFSLARRCQDCPGRYGDCSKSFKRLDPHLTRASLAAQALTCWPRQLPWTIAGDDRVRLEALIRDVVGAWQPVADFTGCSLSIEWNAGPISIEGDRDRVGQALANLLANALEHGGSHVRVKGRRTEDRVVLEVSDDGSGLRANSVSDRSSGQATGRGYGLAIVSDVAAEHGGFFEVVPNKSGALFRLDLPVASASSMEAAA